MELFLFALSCFMGGAKLTKLILLDVAPSAFSVALVVLSAIALPLIFGLLLRSSLYTWVADNARRDAVHR